MKMNIHKNLCFYTTITSPIIKHCVFCFSRISNISWSNTLCHVTQWFNNVNIIFMLCYLNFGWNSKICMIRQFIPKEVWAGAGVCKQQFPVLLSKLLLKWETLSK